MRSRISAKRFRTKVIEEIDWYRREAIKMGNEDAFAELSNLRDTVARMRLTEER